MAKARTLSSSIKRASATTSAGMSDRVRTVRRTAAGASLLRRISSASFSGSDPDPTALICATRARSATRSGSSALLATGKDHRSDTDSPYPLSSSRYRAPLTTSGVLINLGYQD